MGENQAKKSLQTSGKPITPMLNSGIDIWKMIELSHFGDANIPFGNIDILFW